MVKRGFSFLTRIDLTTFGNAVDSYRREIEVLTPSRIVSLAELALL